MQGKLIGVQQGTTSDFKAEEITGQEMPKPKASLPPGLR